MNEKPKYKKIAPVIVIIGVIIIPLLYSYFYLGAFWDPYSRLEKLPVAVVNEDKGAVINDEQRNVGNEMCDELKEDGTLKFVFTDTKTAKEGTEGKKYYATITIPANFSESIKSATTTDKHTAVITYTSNEKRNYLASQILNNAVVKIEETVRSNVNKEIVAQLSDKLKSAPDQLTELSDGLNKLYDGSSDLKDGTSSLNTGARDLQEGAAKLADGTHQLKSGTTTLRKGIASLSDGAGRLKDGSKQLKDGSALLSGKMKEFTKGVGKAAGGSKTVSDNMANLDNGIEKLLDGASKLDASTKNIADLKNGAKSLADGASQLNSGITSYTTGVDSLIANVSETTKVLSAYAKQTGDKTISALVAKLTSAENINSLNQLSQASGSLKTAAGQISAGASTLSDGTANITQLRTAIGQLKAGLQSAKTGSGALSKGAKTLSDSMNQIYGGAEKLSSASAKLSKGAGSLDAGIQTLTKGTDKLSSGASDLSTGVNSLNDGASALKDGTDTLVKGSTDLDKGAGDIKDGIKIAKDGVADSITDADDQLKALDGLDSYAKNPVEVTKEPYAAVPNYGTAFAPYFMSLSLWVGGLLIFFGIYLDADEKFKLLSRNSDNKPLRSFAYLFIGFLQAVILSLILLFFLGLKVNHVGMFFASCILVSLVFISIIQFLLIFFKDVGKFLALLMLILQLTSCGGTFPMETVPKLFNVLYPFMPMTYSVGLFKEAVSGVGNSSLAWHNAGILIIILCVFMGATLIFTSVKKVKEGKLAEA